MKPTYLLIASLSIVLFSCTDYLDSVIIDEESKDVVEKGIHFTSDGGEQEINLTVNNSFSIAETSGTKQWLYVNYEDSIYIPQDETLDIKYIFKITATRNESGEVREGYITLRAPRFEKKIIVTQDGY